MLKGQAAAIVRYKGETAHLSDSIEADFKAVLK